MSWDVKSFREKIEQQHSFPGTYIFKFIVPPDKKDEVVGYLPEGELTFRNSSNKKYISITLKSDVNHSDDIIRVYEKVHLVEGIIAL